MSAIRIFISYSHENKVWLDEHDQRCMLGYWRRAFRKDNVEFWFDRDEAQGIRGGEQWRCRIFEEINRADIAVLLITQDFVISPFIRDEELPYIIELGKQDLIQIIPILVEPAKWKELDLHGMFQMTPGHPTPLSEYLATSEHEWKKARIEILDAFENSINKVKQRKYQSDIPVTKLDISEKNDKEIIHNKKICESIALTENKKAKKKSTSPNYAQINKKLAILSSTIAIFVIIAIIQLFYSKKHKEISILSQNIQEKHSNNLSNKDYGNTQSVLKYDMMTNRLLQGQTWTEPTTGMDFVWVMGGCYQMGCGSWTTNCSDDEKPVHEVCVEGFWLGKYEVTQGEWRKMLGTFPTNEQKQSDRYPIEKVSWNDTQSFLKKFNITTGIDARLPTEAEWEYAARSGGRQEMYAGGSELDKFAWHEHNSNNMSHPVGQKQPNGLGIHDMSGNVEEWCSDFFDPDYYFISPRSNPKGPSLSSFHVTRGGSFISPVKMVQTTARHEGILLFGGPGGGGFRVLIPQTTPLHKDIIESPPIHRYFSFSESNDL